MTFGVPFFAILGCRSACARCCVTWRSAFTTAHYIILYGLVMYLCREFYWIRLCLDIFCALDRQGSVFSLGRKRNMTPVNTFILNRISSLILPTSTITLRDVTGSGHHSAGLHLPSSDARVCAPLGCFPRFPPSCSVPREHICLPFVMTSV